ncbi:MAG: hypothetical protein ACOH2J_20520 [Allorhizobium sp.]
MSRDLPTDLIAAIDALVAMRLEMIKAENFEDAERIATELFEKGITLTDGIDECSGGRVTTWEMKG